MVKDISKYEMFGLDEIKKLIREYKKIEGYSKADIFAEALDGDQAETLAKIIHAQIDWNEGNITDEEFDKRLIVIGKINEIKGEIKWKNSE